MGKKIFLPIILITLAICVNVFIKGDKAQSANELGLVSGISIINVGGSDHSIETYYGKPGIYTLEEQYKILNLTVYNEDVVRVLPDLSLGLGGKIIITRANLVKITDAKKKIEARTWKSNIKEVLDEKSIVLEGKDSVDPGLETIVTNDMNVKITRVSEVEVKEKKVIAFKTIKKQSVDLEKGQTKTEKAGVNGQKEEIYLIKRVDGEQVSKKLTGSSVLKDAESEIIIVGIGPKYVHSGLFQDSLNLAAKKYLINATALQCLMIKESGGGPDTGYPDAQYKGLFQYTDGFWEDASAKAGFSGASIYNAEAQIFTTAWALTHGLSGRWPPYAGCRNK